MTTPPQEKIISFIKKYLRQHHVPPTLREIQEACGYAAIGTVQDHLKNLCRLGLLEIRPRLSRGIMLTQRALGIPIVGRVPAGPAQLMFEEVEGYVSPTDGSARGPATAVLAPAPEPSAAAPHPEGLFALRIKGDSMIEAGILEGDLVIVKPQSSGKNGDIVVARIGDDEATVKRLVRKPGLIQLVPANPKYRPIPVDASIQIVGKVVRVVRHYN